MRVRSLGQLAAAAPQKVCDVCIVGAGAAGLYMAFRLQARGLSVIVLEAGPQQAVPAGETDFSAVFDHAEYRGATEGRFFGLGGSTSRWGGLLVPFVRQDLVVRQGDSDDVWSHIVDVVEAGTPAVASALGVPPRYLAGDFALPSPTAAWATMARHGFRAIAGTHLGFRKRNFRFLADYDSAGAPAEVVLDATVVSWSVVDAPGHGQLVNAVTAVSRGGERIAVSAAAFVIAAGAIESARILLEIEERFPGTLRDAAASVGCDLADHLSVTIATVSANERAETIESFGPWFGTGLMRSIRFIDADPEEVLPRHFAHFVFNFSSRGLLLAKEVLQSMQALRRPRIGPGVCLAASGDLLRLAGARYARRRLHLDSGTPIHLQVDMEQRRGGGNRVLLSTERDGYGRRRALIRWAVSPADLEDLARVAGQVLERWPAGRDGVPNVSPVAMDLSAFKPHDAYHPVGTCSMGTGPRAVVDLNLRVRGLANLYAVTTGIFPSAGSANPTFSMLCFAERLVGDIAGRFGAPAAVGRKPSVQQ